MVLMEVLSSFIPKGWPPSYTQWVSGIYRYLQEKGNTATSVYLNAEEEDFDRIALLGGIRISVTSIDDFVGTVQATIKKDVSLPQEAFALYSSMRLWRANKYPTEIPPFLPILMFSVLSAEQMRSDDTFMSSNYYGRLAALADCNVDHKDKIGYSYRKYIAPLWDSFNDWLLQNPHFGQPTAFVNVSEGFNDYVGVPINQALLRGADQETIEINFFEKFFNSGGFKEIVDLREFTENLEDWMTTSIPSNRLKSIYGKAQDVINVTVWELFERWQPRTRGPGSNGRKAGLKLVLRLSKGLGGKTARFSLNANFENIYNEYLASEVSMGEDAVHNMPLQPDHYVGTGSMVVLADVLSEVLAQNTKWTIRNDYETCFSATRLPRAIVPFEVMTPGVWIEAAQMKLGETYTLLTVTASLEHTMSLLQKFGYGAVVTSVLGIPDQWRLITGFIPTSAVGAPDNLPLQRLDGVQLSLLSGLRLPGGAGIAEYPITEPPMVHVMQASAVKSPVLRIDGPLDWQQQFTNVNAPIAPSFVYAGEYVARLFESTKSRKPLSYRRFILRDSDTSRFQPSVNVGALGVRFDLSHQISVDFGNEANQGLTLVQGARLTRGEVPQFSYFGNSKQHLKNGPNEGANEWEDDIFTKKKSTELAACILNPYARHLKKNLDKVEGRRQRFQRWVCAYCGAFGYIDTRSKKNKQEIKPKILETTELPRVDPSILVERDTEVLAKPREAIEQRIWTLGGGNIREATAFSELHEMSFVTQVMWSIAVAGHVDIVGMETDLCVGEWRTHPLTAVPAKSGFRLVGHRSAAIIEALPACLNKIGATLETKADSDSSQLSELHIVGATSEKLVKLFAEFHGDLHDAIKVDESVVHTFLQSLPPLSVLRDQLQAHAYMDTFNTTEYFDLSSASWLPAQNVNVLGRLVRDSKYGTSYRFVVGGDPVCYQAIVCGYRLGKYLSAHWNKVALLSYDRATEELSVPLGAELPLLYSRGVVYRTNSMPYRRANRSIYSFVSPDIYEHLITLVSG
jgi:hypothetical protein